MLTALHVQAHLNLPASFWGRSSEGSEDINIHLARMKRPWRLSYPTLRRQKGKETEVQGFVSFSKVTSLQGFVGSTKSFFFLTSHNSGHKPHRSYEPRNMHRRTSAKYDLPFQGIQAPPLNPQAHRCQVGKTCFQRYSHCWMNIFNKEPPCGLHPCPLLFPLSASPLSSSMCTHILNSLQ